MNNLKQPPHSPEAEQAVLGSVLMDDKAIDIVAELIEPEHFYFDTNVKIYSAVRMLYKAGKPIDVITVSDLLESLYDDLNDSPIAMVGELVKNTPTAVNVKTYCDVVREKWKGRMLLGAAHDLAEKIYCNEDFDQSREDAYKALDIANTAEVDDCISDADELTDIMIAEMERLEKLGGKLAGLSSGCNHIDSVTGGFARGDYVCIGARSGGGKTTEALDRVAHFTLEGRRTLVFSMEMKKKKLMQKLCSNIGNVKYSMIKSGVYGASDMERDANVGKVATALSVIKDSKLHVDDTAGLSIADVERKARRLKAKYGELDLIVLDYIQRIKHDSSNKYAELSDASNRLKNLFMELDCVGIVLAQLKKNSMGLPNASDLRETGSIENDSDTIIFLHTDSEDRKPTKGMLTAKIFNKVRDGETCIKMLENQLQYQRFKSVDGEYEEPEQGRKPYAS